MNCRRKIPPDLANKYYEQDQRLLRELGIQVYETQVQCNDGELRDFHFTKAPFRNFVGEVAGIVGVMLDITKRKQAELSREQSLDRQERLNLLQQTLLSPGKLQQNSRRSPTMWWISSGPIFAVFGFTGSGDLCETDAHMQSDRGAARLLPPGYMSPAHCEFRDGIRIRTVRFIDACLSLL